MPPRWLPLGQHFFALADGSRHGIQPFALHYNRSVGLFVRGVRGTPLSATRARLEPRKKELELALGATLDDECPLLRNLRLTTTDPSTWSRAYDWLRQSEADYLQALAFDQSAA